MNAYKVELLIIDFDELGREGIEEEIKNTRFANDCIYPSVMNIVERDVGDWDDDHPLNQTETQKTHYEKLFKEKQ